MDSKNTDVSAGHRVGLFLTAGLMRLASWLPLSLNRALGSVLGDVFWLTNGKLKHISLTNLRICYPHLSNAERHALGRSSLRHTGQTLTESAWVWLRHPDTLFRRTRIVEGEALFTEAMASERGVLFATPHIGNWEACNIVVARHQSITYLYRPPRKSWLEPLFIRWRANFNATPARLNASGLRHVLSELKAGRVVGILPDQEPDISGGVFAPLFGEPANSMTLLQKLGRRGDADVLFCVCARESGRWFSRKPGWRVSFVKPEEQLLAADPVVAATALNRSIERCIERNPEQYLWSYKRFNLMENGERRQYR